jgi:hypothetical protein
MRARQRHFNARDAGATLVLDARRISGLNDGDGVQTWPDISRNANDATQATSGNRPVYKTAIQGGCPVVRFTKASTHYLRTSAGPFGTSAGIFILGVASRNASVDTAVVISHGDLATAAGSCSSLLFEFGNRKFTSNAFSGTTGAGSTVATALNQDVFGIGTSQAQASSTLKIRLNGGAEVASATALPGNLNNISTAYGIGANGGGAIVTGVTLDGQIALAVIAAGLVISSPVRRRIEQSAAYSFKIACS